MQPNINVPDINSTYETISIFLRPINEMYLPIIAIDRDYIKVSNDIMIPIYDSVIPF